MSAAPPLQALCPEATHWREQLLGATAQASRLLLESSDVMSRMPEVLQLIGEAAGVDRTTLALAEVDSDGERWLEGARNRVFESVREQMKLEHHLTDGEFDSIARGVRSQLDLSITATISEFTESASSSETDLPSPDPDYESDPGGLKG